MVWAVYGYNNDIDLKQCRFQYNLYYARSNPSNWQQFENHRVVVGCRLSWHDVDVDVNVKKGRVE